MAARVKFCKLWLLLSLLWSHPLQGDSKSKKPIVIAVNDWTSQMVLSHVLKTLYEHQGYIVTLKNLKTGRQWGQLPRGWAHVQVEVWQGTMETQFNRLVASGDVLDAGTHAAVTREDWWYPTYMEERCPGLPDWRALKKCSKEFATESSGGKGRYLGGPWEKPDDARIRALGLDFIIEKAEQGSDLWVELDKAYRNKEPIVLFNWTPNWVEAKYDGKFIEFPEFAPECETDPKWGVSKSWTYDCGNPKNGWLKKLAWEGMTKEWPCALKILRNVNFDNKMIAELAAYVDAQQLSYESAASRWIKSYSQIWQSWIPEKCER